MKKVLTLVIGTLLLLTVVDCTKRPVKPVKKANGSELSDSGGSSVFGNVNLVKATGNFFKKAFSGFGGSGKPLKLDRNTALVGMALIGAVILGFVIYFQNRPPKSRRSDSLAPGTRGRYRI